MERDSFLLFMQLQPQTAKRLSIAFLVALVAWGAYTFFYYMGVPVHRSALLSQEAYVNVETACTSILCRGVMATWSWIPYLWSELAPFAWYIVLSMVIIAGLLAWQYVRNGGFTWKWTFKPWHFLALFVVSLWLLFTTLSNATFDGLSVRLLPEPTAQTYQGVSDETLATLKTNFDQLQASGCLSASDTTANNGMALYSLKGFCVQKSFVTMVLSQLLVVLVLLFECLVLGSSLLRLSKIRFDDPFVDGMTSVATGVAAWTVLLFLTALAGAYTQAAGWALVVLVPAACYRSVLRWGKALLTTEWNVESRLSRFGVVAAWLLVTYLAFNFLTVIRPFPIGWDDLGSYLNRPRLLVSYGSFIPTMATFQWEYLTSLGFLLFGYSSFFGATAAMIINWTEGLLASLAVVVFCRQMLGNKSGLVAALAFYTLPLIGHFSFADMKIDNATFFMGAMATVALFAYLWPSRPDAEAEDVPSHSAASWRYVALAGVLAGFAFSFKITAAMVLMELFAILAGSLLGWTAFLGASSLAFAAFFLNGAFNAGVIMQRIGLATGSASRMSFVLVFGLVGLGLLAWSAWKSPERKRGLKMIGLFLAGAIIVVLPWDLNNSLRLGNSLVSVSTTAPNMLSPTFVIGRGEARPTTGPVRVLPDDLLVDPAHPACIGTAATEELDRYWGFRTGATHYLTLPFRTVMNLDSAGYYVTTMAALLLFPLLLLLPYFWTERAKRLRYLFAGTVLILVEWMFSGNGVPWYGVGIFLGLAVGLEALIRHAPGKASRYAAMTFVTLSLLTNITMRLWQFDQQKNLLEYPMGKVSAEAMQSRTIPWYDGIQKIVTERAASMPETPYLYRIGTFIPYFIPKNLETVPIGDQQLSFFNCLNQEKDPALTLKRLKALGFNSIIFDTNTATIESDTNGSLHQKVNSFVDFVNTPSLGLQVLVNDPNAGVAFVLIP